MLNNNLLALVLTVLIAIVWLRLNDFIAHRGWVSSVISRKIIHIGTGPIFVLCWLLFNETPSAPYLAALIPLAITIQFALVGAGVIKDPSAVTAMSRTGDRREILRGPLFYGIAFVVLTIVFWRRSPIGIVAMMMLCGGDGLADIVGKKVGGIKLPWSLKKSLAGSLTMLLGGFVFSVLVVWVFVWQNFFPHPMSQYLLPIAVIAVATTITESLPYSDVDNITVPLVSSLLGLFIF
ncbi:MAG TPA: phosphatidate cytidylyltransferase [Brevefilum fermentans]|jgi:phytol kinase|uniref:Putative phosphatidate cytidylyltransferase n=1 Tax=Candidatus Brevifilum fermentans TaxID=1986204 RepID=A0A1Y6K4L6_9CHLR|nr:phosphatidate cytidylyltransferase [Brevefilum fermentans]MDI9566456.1 phosphatidate cytidylyltransferase [Chloroflexota bacterium]SMX54554.1 putative phosphatidate cytidylyltransferase [Brevefilum fermentans]HOM67158.1 phosphatidate cytidylyltransferase [Brevefilum fermentans]HPX95728.1 phosphatidate cytidylyltransferase [Brevefilum fermentans]HQA27906.1 phosphatidate cytidylyltransferase [Brevefilum fermentans]